ncbi:hypothetical protein RJT34_17318 [Clitoria ternatea]|uniref:Uncharacterized protein n=1 Tax=Clitoria ternatea TaxID=43366 RepID=A0AAN9JBW0_CLITE
MISVVGKSGKVENQLIMVIVNDEEKGAKILGEGCVWEFGTLVDDDDVGVDKGTDMINCLPSLWACHGHCLLKRIEAACSYYNLFRI